MDAKRRTAMKYYAGLDISLEETSIRIVDGEGRIGLILRFENLGFLRRTEF